MTTQELKPMQSMHQDDNNVLPLDRRKHDMALDLILSQVEQPGEKLDGHIQSRAKHGELSAITDFDLAIGLTNEDIDNLFISASKIK